MQGAALQALSVALLLREPPNVRVGGTAFIDFLIRYVNDASGSLYIHKLREIKELLPNAPPLEVARLLGNGIEAYQAVPLCALLFFKSSDVFTRGGSLCDQFGRRHRYDR